MKKIKPCPLCGCEVVVTEFTIGTPYNNGKCVDYQAKIECECGLTFEHEWTEIKSADGPIIRSGNIIDVWNRRVQCD
jgi:hypothetical protein